MSKLSEEVARVQLERDVCLRLLREWYFWWETYGKHDAGAVYDTARVAPPIKTTREALANKEAL